MADATATEKSDYKVKIEDVGAAKRRLEITVPARVIDEKIEQSMGTLATQTSLPGFRKGRAPKALLERRFGSAVREETRNQIIADGYAKAIEQNEIRPVSEPDPVGALDELELVPGKPFTFTVEVEVVPEFELPEVEGVEIRKPIIDVEPEHIDTELTRQRTLAGTIVAVEDGFTEGDRLLGPGQATKEGDEEPFFTHDNVDIIVPGEADGGRGHVLGLVIEGLRGKLSKAKVGDTLVFEATGPEGHEVEEIRGKKLTIEFTVREGQRIDPAPVERVMEQYGIATEEILREQLKVALEQRRDQEQRSAMREQVYDHLLDAVDFEVPAKLSAAQAARMLERQRLELLYRGGLSADEVEARLAELRDETRSQSTQRLKLSFILHRLAEKFDVTVTDQEVNGRIAQIAVQRGVRPDKLRSDLIQSGAIGQIATQIREHKAADRVIDHARVVDITAEEWNRAVGERVAARRAAAKASGASGKTSTRKTTTKKAGSGKKAPAKK